MTARVLDLQPGTPSPGHVLSKTTAAIIVGKSPRHAMLRKRRELDEETTDAMDLGTIVHAILLGKANKPIRVNTEFQDYKKKAAREWKASVIAEGGIPILGKKADFAQRVAERFRASMIAQGHRLNGESELAIEWTETDAEGEPVTCWGALDHWHPETRTIYDLKIGESGHPDACGRSLRTLGGLIQAAAYTSAIGQLYPSFQGRTRFVFLFGEISSGEVTPVMLSGDLRRLGELQWQRAIDAWGHGLRTDEWPGYAPHGPIVLHAKPWELDAEADASAAADHLNRNYEGDSNDE